MMKRLLLLLLTLPLLAGAGLVQIESPRHYRALLIGNADYPAQPPPTSRFTTAPAGPGRPW